MNDFKPIIKVVTKKVILDIVMGYSVDIAEQTELLNELSNDINKALEEEVKKEAEA